jgi:PAS domain S-box-containing protein
VTQDGPPNPDASDRRVAELEAEVEELRRALARRDAVRSAGRAAARRKGERAPDDAPSYQPDLAEAEAETATLRRIARELEESRAALREHEARLRLILDSATDFAIFTTDLDLRVTSWNEGARRLLGWEEGAILGRSAALIFTPEDRAAGVPERERAQALETGRAEDERWHLRADGSRFWGSGLVMPLRDPAAAPDAPPLGLLKIMRDLTGRRRAEEALRESEEHLRHIVELSPQILWTADREGNVTAISGRVRQLSGIAGEEMLGEGWARIVHPDELPRLFEAKARALATGQPLDVEYRFRLADGSYRWMRSRAYPRRDASGRIVGWYGTTEDIHDRRVAEARLAALVELGDRLRELHDPATIAQAAAEVIGRGLEAARAGYGTVDPEERLIRIERDWTRGTAASFAGEHRLMDYWAGFVEELRRGEVVAIGDTARDPRTAASAAGFAAVGVRACVHVPVTREGRVVALLYVHDAAPRRWTEEEVDFVRGVAERAWAATERAQAEERRALLLAELNHRVKNTLAVVQALALQTARSAPDLPSFVSAFQARLIALGRAHDLLTQADWRGATAEEVVRTELRGEERADLGGCASPAVLPPVQALALALALHELATNAAKHGALSTPEGRVFVACRTDPADGATLIEWVERGGPTVSGPPVRHGFGLRLLQRGLARQAGMEAELRFEPEGLRCTLRLPVRANAAAGRARRTRP